MPVIIDGSASATFNTPLPALQVAIIPVTRGGTGAITAAAARASLGVVIDKVFTSANQTIVIGGGITIAHGLGVKPILVRWALVCLTASVGYLVGDELTAIIQGAGGGLEIIPDATNLIVRYSDDAVPFQSIDKTTGGSVGLPSANFALIIRAWA